MRDALSAITIIYKELWEYQHDPLTNGWRLRPGSAASQWQEFVARALRDENLAYTLDDQCGVHPLVDVEFERNSAATVRSLGEARYAAVRTAFEAGKSKLDALPQDRKGAIRDLFEAVETLTKLVSNSGKALDSGFVRGEIQRIVARLHAEDAVARRSGGAMCLSLADWVDAAHPYRHGQQVEEPVEPPEELTVLIFSQGAAFIRWLVDIDQQENGGGT
jgi:hypothetical protein